MKLDCTIGLKTAKSPALEHVQGGGPALPGPADEVIA